MFYPSLIQALQKNEPQETQAILNRLEIRRDELKSRLSSAHSDDHRSMQASLGYLEIEIYSLKALDPFSELSVRLVNLRKLLALIPDELEFKHDVEGIIGALDQPKASGIKWLKVQTTDSWEDSLLAGTEVSNSCQRIDGDPDLNKCLLAYILDGKNLLMIVRDSEEKIAARSVLRILWNERRNHPVLFMERIYTRTADPILCDLILKGCVEKAKYMGLPLVCSPSSYPKGRPYRGVLEALGGPAPFEYVDALLGIQPDGVFTIPSSNIIFTPDVGHALGRGAKAGAAAGPSHRAVQ